MFLCEKKAALTDALCAPSWARRTWTRSAQQVRARRSAQHRVLWIHPLLHLHSSTERTFTKQASLRHSLGCLKLSLIAYIYPLERARHERETWYVCVFSEPSRSGERVRVIIHMGAATRFHILYKWAPTANHHRGRGIVPFKWFKCKPRELKNEGVFIEINWYKALCRKIQKEKREKRNYSGRNLPKSSLIKLLYAMKHMYVEMYWGGDPPFTLRTNLTSPFGTSGT